MSRLKRVARIDTNEHGGIMSVHVGGFHTFVRCEKAVLGFGCNDDGQLGTGDRTSRKTPHVISFFDNPGNVVDLSCGAYHSVALLRDGSLHAAGRNEHGQLGLGDKDGRHRFIKLTSVDEARALSVSCGSHHTTAMLSPVPDVAVAMACGKGDFGELGYDADSWDVAEEQERRIKLQVAARAHVHTMQGVESSAPHYSSVRVGQGSSSMSQAVEQQLRDQALQPFDSAATGKPMFKPRPKFGDGKPVVKRRDAFSRPTLSIIRLPPTLLPPAVPPSDGPMRAADLPDGNSDDPLARIIRLATDNAVDNDLPELVCGFHHHSAFRTRRTKHWYHFGCYFCNGIETVESSVPVPVVLPNAERCAGVHAADEALFAWSTTGKLFVKGKGILAGDDEAVIESFTPVDLNTAVDENGWRVATIESVRGVQFVVVCAILEPTGVGDQLDNQTAETPRRMWFVLGDNYFGQLGTGDEENRGRPVRLQFPAAISRPVDVQPGYRHLVVLAEEHPAK